MLIRATKIGLPIVILVMVASGVFYFEGNQSGQEAEIIQTIQRNTVATDAQANLLPIALPNLIEPVEGFRDRIIKKPFGIFVTPETSPVQPDRFTGYHNGVDVEYDDVADDVPVRAIADGTILVRARMSGYGGVVVIRHTLNGINILALYGHLDSVSFLPASITEVAAGEQIGILGNGYSEETDGVRKHLHFSFHSDTGDKKIDFRGYVKAEEELRDWLNPLDFYR
ncbi:MAG: M23 family metallopeptidase [bacterium]|nr:M23 family metallopeptidase [bacterium]